MRYRLRTLLIVQAIGPPLMAEAWFWWPKMVAVIIVWQLLGFFVLVGAMPDLIACALSSHSDYLAGRKQRDEPSPQKPCSATSFARC